MVLLSRSLNFFLRTLNTGQFLRVWKNFAPLQGNSTIIFWPGAENYTKKIARMAGIRSLKKISPGLPEGVYPVGID